MENTICPKKLLKRHLKSEGGRRRLLSTGASTLLLLLAFLAWIPLTDTIVYAEGSNSILLVNNGEAPDIKGAQGSSVYFGNYRQSSDGNNGFKTEPVKWRVLSNENSKLFLLANQNLDCKKYNEEVASSWESSSIKRWLNADFVNGAFSEGEKGAIAERTLESSIDKNKAFLLSLDDVRNPSLGFSDNNSRKSLNTDFARSQGACRVNGEGDWWNWWLRTLGKVWIYDHEWHTHDGKWVESTSTAVAVDEDGSIPENDVGLDIKTIWVAVRPALDLDLSSVILASTATGGKDSGEMGADSLKAVGSNTDNEWKMTVKNGHDSFSVGTVTSCDGKNLSIKYSGAATGSNEYISGIIKDKDGKITYYGNLKNCAEEGDASGTAKVKIDGKLGIEDTLYIFNEQSNGDKKTDFASELKEVTIPQTLTHDMTHHDAAAPTCTEDGAVEYWSCGNCGKNFGDAQGTTALDTIVDPKTGHNMTHHDAVAPTCTEDGTVEYWSCEKCKKNFGDKQGDTELTDIVDPKTGHNMTHHDAAAPTCTEDGTVEHWSCEKCKKNFGDEQVTTELDTIVIPKTGHKYGAWTKLNATQHQRVCAHDKTHVQKANHTWDKGKVTKKATEKANGIKTYTCTACKATKTQIIPKLAPKVSGTLIGKMIAKGNTGLVISWNKIQGAAGYDIFLARCNHDGKKISCKKVKTVKEGKTFKWTKTGLKKGSSYKAYVKAFVYKNGKKSYVRTSPMMHAYTGNGTKYYTNARSVTVNKTTVTLKKGKIFKIKAAVNKVSKNKKLMPKGHAPAVRYMTSNSKIAAVSSGGKITAKGKGVCYIYTFAHNGVSKQVKVTVR